MSSSRTVTDRWTLIVWRLLCLLTCITALALITGPYWLLPSVWQGLAVMPGLLVMLLILVASVHDSGRSQHGSGAVSCDA